MFKRRPYRVRVKGRAGLTYEEGNRKVTLDSEMLAGGDFDMVVYLASMEAWDPPDDATRLSQEDVSRIKKNVTSELWKYRIDWQ